MMVCADASTAQVRTRSVDENMVDNMVDCARFGTAMSVRIPNSCDRLRAAPVRFPLFKFLVFSLVSHQIPFRITALRRSCGLCKWRRLGCYRPSKHDHHWREFAINVEDSRLGMELEMNQDRESTKGNAGQWEGNIWRHRLVRPVPSSLQPPRPATTTNIALSPPPPRKSKQGTTTPTLHAEDRPPNLDRLFGSKLADGPATQRQSSWLQTASWCMPTLPPPVIRRPCGQWAAATGRSAAGESLCWGDCRSITSPMPSSLLGLALEQSPMSLQWAAAPHGFWAAPRFCCGPLAFRVRLLRDHVFLQIDDDDRTCIVASLSSSHVLVWGYRLEMQVHHGPGLGDGLERRDQNNAGAKSRRLHGGGFGVQITVTSSSLSTWLSSSNPFAGLSAQPPKSESAGVPHRMTSSRGAVSTETFRSVPPVAQCRFFQRTGISCDPKLFRTGCILIQRADTQGDGVVDGDAHFLRRPQPARGETTSDALQTAWSFCPIN